jgi:hypothetical protein
MPDIYDLEPLSPAERRLLADAAFGPLNYPDDLAHRNQYFRDGLTLLRAVKDQPEKVRTVVASYLKYTTDPALASELETFLGSLQSEESANLAKAPGSSQ